MRDAREPVPAVEGALRQAAVDHDLRDVQLGEFHDGRRPKLRLNEERAFRPPMSEEAADEAGHVDRRELVDGARRQAPGGDIGGGDGDGSEDHADPGGDDPID